MKILITDDEDDILELIAYNLEREGYEVLRSNNGLDTLQIAEKEKPDVIILDIMMPKLDGIETCRRLRAIPSLKETYIIFLTARAEEYSELAGFEVGADDYITKPIKPRVLISRIKAVMRRGTIGDSQLEDNSCLQVHDLEIDRGEYVVRRNTTEFSLPRKEFELLFCLASKPGKIFKREELLEKIWGDVYVVDRTVDVHIRKLREKLGEEYIQTIKGVGYKFLSDK